MNQKDLAQILRNSDLADRDLSGLDFSDKIIEKVDFSRSVFDGAIFRSTELRECVLDGVRIAPRSIDSLTLSGCSTSGCVIGALEVSKGDVSISRSIGAQSTPPCDATSRPRLDQSTFDSLVSDYECRMWDLGVRYLPIPDRDLEILASLSPLEFRDLDLRGLDYCKDWLVRSRFVNCDLRDFTFYDINFLDVTFDSCDLSQVDMLDANFYFSKICKSKFSKNHFTSRVGFYSTALCCADFFGDIFTAVEFSGYLDDDR